MLWSPPILMAHFHLLLPQTAMHSCIGTHHVDVCPHVNNKLVLYSASSGQTLNKIQCFHHIHIWVHVICTTVV